MDYNLDEFHKPDPDHLNQKINGIVEARNLFNLVCLIQDPNCLDTDMCFVHVGKPQSS